MHTRRLLNFLLIEDDHEDIEIFTEILAGLSKDIFLTTIEDGLIALKMLRAAECHPHYIVLDLGLPSLGGIEFLEMTKQEQLIQNIPVIVHSSYSQNTLISKCNALGVESFIKKSHDNLILKKKLKECLDGGRPTL